MKILCFVCLIILLHGSLYGEIVQTRVKIGLAVDYNSKIDALLVANSILQTAFQPENVQFYVLACGRNESDANILKVHILTLFTSYFPRIHFDVRPFYLPQSSGFYTQLATSQKGSKKQKHHWNSPIGADMARFYLSSIFSHVDKLLYLDNDVIVTCCVEEIYNTQLNETQVIGIGLDDLHWATVTQFQRHYNASHPLLIKHVRKGLTNASMPVSNEEFLHAVPKYPNDGVILFNVPSYNIAGVLDDMNEIASANAMENDYVIGMGTQQFTVLTMHNKWKELSTRSNLRHFPSMARGFLMWYYFHGILHYAGSFKPRNLCQFTTYRDHNWLRVQSYHPWLMNNYNLMEVSQGVKHNDVNFLGYYAKSLPYNITALSQLSNASYYGHCHQHILLPYEIRQLLIIINSLANLSFEVNSNNLVVFIGNLSSVAPNEFKEQYSSNLNVPTLLDELSKVAEFSTLNEKWVSESFSGKFPNSLYATKLFHLVIQIILYRSNWNFRIFADTKNNYTYGPTGNNLIVSRQTYSTTEQQVINSIVNEFESSIQFSSKSKRLLMKHKKKNSSPKVRDINANFDHLCYIESATFLTDEISDSKCLDILNFLKLHKYKHWDIIGMVIDKKNVIETLQILNALNMGYLRPKFFLVHIESFSLTDADKAILQIQKFLNRNGYHHSYYIENAITSYHGWVWGTRVSILEFT
jgi:lipopolysaccharide biosynthesis glycosyltransferase